MNGLKRLSRFILHVPISKTGGLLITALLSIMYAHGSMVFKNNLLVSKTVLHEFAPPRCFKSSWGWGCKAEGLGALKEIQIPQANPSHSDLVGLRWDSDGEFLYTLQMILKQPDLEPTWRPNFVLIFAFLQVIRGSLLLPHLLPRIHLSPILVTAPDFALNYGSSACSQQ